MKLPVLLYHHIGPLRPGTYPSLTISPERFERHVRWLARRGYTGITPSDWLAWIRKGKLLPAKPVMLTFDDTYADLTQYALPVLKRYGFGAAVFVVTGQIGGKNIWDEVRGSGTHELMTAEQIRQWASQGIEFGAHSRTHADLSTLGQAEVEQEVSGSGEDLENILGVPVTAFAYPYGLYNEAVQECVRDKYELAFTVEDGLCNVQTNPYLLPRTMVQPSDSIIDLACRVRLGWSPVQRLRAHVRLRSRFRSALQSLQRCSGVMQH